MNTTAKTLTGVYTSNLAKIINIKEIAIKPISVQVFIAISLCFLIYNIDISIFYDEPDIEYQKKQYLYKIIQLLNLKIYKPKNICNNKKILLKKYDIF